MHVNHPVTHICVLHTTPHTHIQMHTTHTYDYLTNTCIPLPTYTHINTILQVHTAHSTHHTHRDRYYMLLIYSNRSWTQEFASHQIDTWPDVYSDILSFCSAHCQDTPVSDWFGRMLVLELLTEFHNPEPRPLLSSWTCAISQGYLSAPVPIGLCLGLNPSMASLHLLSQAMNT